MWKGPISCIYPWLLWPHEYTLPVTSRRQNFTKPLPSLCLLYFLKIYFVVYLCLCACLPPVYAYMHKPEEGIMPSWAGITDSSELPNVGAGNKTLVPLKEHKHSYPMSHLFRSLALTFFQLSLLQCSLGLSHSGFGTEQSLILSPLTSYGSTNHLASQKAWST